MIHFWFWYKYGAERRRAERSSFNAYTTRMHNSRKTCCMVFLSRNHLESILMISFSIAAILITLPCEYKAEENGGDIDGGGGTRTSLVPTVIFNNLPLSTFHAFVISLLFAFTSSLSALLMHGTDNGTRNKSNYSQLLHVVITRCFGWSSLAFITSALAILFQALLLTATSSPPPPPPLR